MTFLIAILGFTAFEVLAYRYGAESRPEFSGSFHRQPVRNV